MKNKSKKVFITGSGSGLGMDAAITLARRGHIVYASVHYESEIEKLRTIAKSENLNLHAFKLDILEENDRKIILDYNFDVFISNSAIGDSGSVADIDISRIRNVFETNVFCNLHMIQLALEKMVALKSGRIIILSSIVGRIPMPFLSPYCASKFSLECFATCLKYELKILNKLSGTNIKVALIEPGAYATGFNKENNSKKYEWMYTNSYFSKYADLIRKYEIKIWNFLEQKPYTSIIKKYVKCVEDKHLKFRYTSPWWQSSFIQLLRIFGL
ncbi:MAG: SDR family NAD(P)-dependent oxidoreductase [Clostridia bacterium]|nr:SDR family NAD(P)-dependent oxidoreductase [Clostridia bacterium]